MHHVAEILNQDVPPQTLERLVRVELLCLRSADGARLAAPDGDGVFVLRGAAARRGATLLHVFDEEAADVAEILMALVDDAGLPLSYKDADQEEDFTDAAAFGRWLERQDAEQLQLLVERMQDLL